MSWTDVLNDARNVIAFDGDRVPPLDRVVLHEIRLHRDGLHVTFVVGLPDFPPNPPEK